MRTFLIRSGSALVFGVLVIGSLLLDPWLFSSLMLIFTVLGLWEFFSINVYPDAKPNKITGLFAGIVLYITLAFVAHGKGLVALLFLNFLSMVLVFLTELFSKSKLPFLNIGVTILGVIYVALPLALLNFFYYPTFQNAPNAAVLLSFFVLIWVNDTFAYITGILLGRTALFTRISPKKTWEGSLGGMVFTLVCSWIISLNFNLLSPVEWAGFAFLVVIFGTFGDLIESMLKRSLQIKDSGSIMPGHGGILDRFDAALFAAPVIFAYLCLLYFYF